MIPTRRHLLVALCAVAAGGGIDDVAVAATTRTQSVLYVGNNWDGTAHVVNPRTFKVMTRINIVPDLKERLAEIESNPDRLGYFLAIRQAVGEGHDQFVDDMFSSHDGRFLYVSRPSLADVIGLDLRTRKIVWRTPVEGYRADHMAISPDGRRLLVSASTARKVHVIDTATGRIVGFFESGDQPHENNYSRDGSLIYHASIGTVYTPLDDPAFDSTKGDRWFQIVDARTLRVLKRIDMGQKLAEAGYPDMSSAVRPMALSPDERFLYFQVSFFHGFVEYDLQQDRVLRLAHLPLSEDAKQMRREQYLLDSAHHGLAMNPEGTKLCAAGTMSDYAAIVSRQTFAYRLAAFGKKPYWATNSGDGRYCFVSFSGDDRIGAISYASEREVARVQVGDHPQRMRMGKAVLDLTCLARRSPVGPRGIGRVRLGRSRAALRRGIPFRPVGQTRRSWRYCVTGGGRVNAVFSRRGTAMLVATTAPNHGNRGVRPGGAARRLAAAYPRRRRIARGLYRAAPRSRLLIGTARGRIRFMAVHSRALRGSSSLRAALRAAGVR